MKPKIIIAIYILMAIVLIAFGYSIIKERYFDEKTTTPGEKIIDRPSESDNETNAGEEKTENGEENSKNGKEDENEEDDSVPEEEAFVEIKTAHCKNRCADFGDADELEYCRQICGLVVQQPDKTENCPNLEGLDADYCWKNKAVAAKDFKLCEKIQDAGVKKSCKNRVSEEIFNGEF